MQGVVVVVIPVQRHGGGQGVVQFDVFQIALVDADDRSGVIHDLGDNHVAGPGPVVGRPERWRNHRIQFADVIGPAAERHAVFRRAERDVVHEAGRGAAGARRDQPDVVPVNTAQAEIIGVVVAGVGVQSGGVEVVLVEDDVLSGCEQSSGHSAGGDLVLEVVVVRVADPPPGDVDGRPRGIVQFDGVGLGQVGVREDLVDHHVAERSGARQAGRSAVFRTGAPVVARVVVSGGVDDLERTGAAVGAGGPTVGVVVSELLDDCVEGVLHADLLAVVADDPNVLAGHADARTVSLLEGERVGDDDDTLAGGEGRHGAGGKVERQAAGESRAGDVERFARHVDKLDVLEGVGVGEAGGNLGGAGVVGQVVDLGDSEPVDNAGGEHEAWFERFDAGTRRSRGSAGGRILPMPESLNQVVKHIPRSSGCVTTRSRRLVQESHPHVVESPWYQPAWPPPRRLALASCHSLSPEEEHAHLDHTQSRGQACHIRMISGLTAST